MRCALELAARGRGRTSPNPMVGAVIFKGKKIIAKGWHRRCGLAHAEVEALKKAGSRARGASMAVTLEPCDHHGRTGPCTMAIIRAGIMNVQVGSMDPNPLVRGKGLSRLRRAGIKVHTGILGPEEKELNRGYRKRIRTGRPFVLLKAAVTLDGRLAAADGSARWISGAASRAEVRRIRRASDAICVGSGTVRMDDPSLTDGTGRLMRVILNRDLDLVEKSYRVFDDSAKTVVFAGPGAPEHKAAKFRKMNISVERVKLDNGRLDLGDVLDRLGKAGVCNLLVEGGSALHTSMIKNGLADEMRVYVCPVLLGSGPPLAGEMGISTMSGALRPGRSSWSISGTDAVLVWKPGKKKR